VSDIGIDELARRLGELTVVDVRTAEEYDGVRGAPCDPRQGHIPGAVHVELDRLVNLGADEVGARLRLSEGAEVVAYCHSGARSAVAVEILSRLGYAARNYVGSWHEWSRSDQPLEAGSER
jgi:thiosulfate/3-mercaptopyruvate sulfurtransferase